MTILERLHASAQWASVLANGCRNFKTSFELQRHADNLRNIVADIERDLKEIADRRQKTECEVAGQRIADGQTSNLQTNFN